MLDLLYQGGPLFMGMLTLIFFVMLVVAYTKGMPVLQGNSTSSTADLRQGISYIKAVGGFALVIGILGQLIGLYSAFAAMEGMEGGISPTILAGGLRVSMITTLYGVLIYVISYLIWLVLSWRLK